MCAEITESKATDECSGEGGAEKRIDPFSGSSSLGGKPWLADEDQQEGISSFSESCNFLSLRAFVSQPFGQ